ncbi:MAG: hypothetical protein AAB407_03645 [Patescibacteria group bacterium]
MTERMAKILGATVQEFIETGMPISSGELYSKHGFDVKPATIRNELNALTESGYLMQPYTSGGRIPTDKGYQFFVHEVLNHLHEEHRKASEKIVALKEALMRQQFAGFVNNVAEHFGVLGVGYTPTNRSLVKSNIHELIGDLVKSHTITDLDEIYDIIRDFETLDARMGELSETIPRQDNPSVFVGKNPITKSPHLSVIADRFSIGDEEILITVIGPKRMDYGSRIRFFVQLKDHMNNHE